MDEQASVTREGRTWRSKRECIRSKSRIVGSQGLRERRPEVVGQSGARRDGSRRRGVRSPEESEEKVGGQGGERDDDA